MRSLQFALSFEPGGRREAVLTLARGLAKRDQRCALACADDLGCDPSVVVDVFHPVQSLERNGTGSTAAVKRLIALCDDHHIELIHAHDAASQWIASRAIAKRPRIKLLMTFHRSLGFESATWKAKLRNALAGRSTAAIVVGSKERRRHYLSENFVPAAKVVRIPFGVDLNRFRPDVVARQQLREELRLQQDQPLIGAVGHFGSEKGIDVAIAGFRAFLQACPENRPEKIAKLLVIGRGTEEQQRRIRSLVEGAEDRIVLAGFRRDVEKCFAAMDVFLHVPRQEAFGLVVAEAMACGVPIVASSVGGVPDMVREGVTGHLVPPEQPEGIAAALHALIADPRHREQLGAAAHQVAQAEYSVSLYVRRYMDLYRDILHDRPPRGVDETGEG